jgi:hypothetical protein
MELVRNHLEAAGEDQLREMVKMMAEGLMDAEARSGRPQHRSERALLTHSAPASGAGIEALVGPRVNNACTRDLSISETLYA